MNTLDVDALEAIEEQIRRVEESDGDDQQALFEELIEMYRDLFGEHTDTFLYCMYWHNGAIMHELFHDLVRGN